VLWAAPSQEFQFLVFKRIRSAKKLLEFFDCSNRQVPNVRYVSLKR
jgi:hypothetical protein